MRTLVICMCLCIGSATQKEKLDEAFKHLSEPQLLALTLVGSTLQKAHLPAPWMGSTEMQQRRLQQSPMPPLSDECIAACPKAQAAIEPLAASMTQEITNDPGMKALAIDSANGAQLDMEKVLQAYGPVLKRVMKSVYDNMCQHKDAYVCVASNSACVSSDPDLAAAINQGNPAGFAKQYKASLECICNVCSGATTALADFAATTASAVMKGVMSMMSGGSVSAADEEQAKKDLLSGMCPLYGMNRCFLANPNQCSSAFMEGMSGLTEVEGMKISDAEDLKKVCDTNSISTEVTSVAAPVKTVLTLKGLDFSKVSASAELAAAIVDKVKKRVVAALTAYLESDITVVLSSGSVVATVSVQPVAGAPSSALETSLAAQTDAIAAGVTTDVKAVPNIESALTAGTSKEQITGTASAPSVSVLETSGVDMASSLGTFSMAAAMFAQMMAWVH